MNNEKVYNMSISKIYPLLVNKATRKGRTEEEVLTVMEWLTGYNRKDISRAVEEAITYRTFFENAPAMNPKRRLIRGKICGIQVETIEESMMQEIRYLDKLIDELAKGKTMDKILRD